MIGNVVPEPEGFHVFAFLLPVPGQVRTGFAGDLLQR